MNIKRFIFLLSLFVSVNSQDQCGISDTNSARPSGLIFNGELAQDGQWPWAAALYLIDGKYRNYFCSGTLIGDRFVLTGECFLKS
jgi:secreted trypsin-like serine protease